MLQNPRKTLGFKKNMVYKIPPGGGGKPYPASGLFILDFVHNWIHLFKFGMCLCNKYSTVNNFKKPPCEQLFAR